MIITAQTANGWMIEASEAEITEILNAVLGTSTRHEVKIGTKLPAVDYAETIHKVKYLKESGVFKELNTRANQFAKGLERLNEAVESAHKINK